MSRCNPRDRRRFRGVYCIHIQYKKLRKEKKYVSVCVLLGACLVHSPAVKIECFLRNVGEIILELLRVVACESLKSDRQIVQATEKKKRNG
jgi:hypothetical protein